MHASKIMNTLRSIFPNGVSHRVIGIVGAALLAFACSLAYAQDQAAATDQAPPIPAEQIDSLVAPIALYPDALLAQTLAASTYPLEVMQLDQWMAKNTNLKDKALADAVAKQPWDPSVQSMAAFPDVVKRMAENIQWMTEIGNAFLEQQKDVMDSVQRMRAKAQGTGNLKTGGETKVETKTSQGGQQVVVIEQTNPQEVYVPSYDPAVVYGAAPAEAPYYPYTYPGYQPGRALAWGTAIAVGGAWANDNWGNCNWDDGDVTINNNNTYNKNSNVNKGNANKGNGNGWQHNPQHRGNAPYANKQTANKYGGTARGETRPSGAGAAGAGATRPSSGGANANARPGGSGAGTKNVDAGNRPGGGSGAGKAGGGAAGGAGGAKAAKSGGGGNKVGNHSVSSGSNGNAFGGPGSNGSSAKAASNRGGSSMKGGGSGPKGGGGAKAGGGGGGRGGGGGGGGRGGGGGGGRKR